MTYGRLSTPSSLSCTLSLAVFQSLWQVWKGRRNFSVFRETSASINHICLWHVQILDIVSLPSSVFTLFEYICSGESGLGTLPTSSSNYWGKVQCHARSYSFRLLWIQRHKQDFPAQVKICCAQNTHTYVCKHMIDIRLNQWLLLWEMLLGKTKMKAPVLTTHFCSWTQILEKSHSVYIKGDYSEKALQQAITTWHVGSFSSVSFCGASAFEKPTQTVVLTAR